jgi:hypothetical protein
MVHGRGGGDRRCASGRIEHSRARSPCTRQEYDGPGRSRQCDKRMPYPIRYRPDALLNAAVFHDAMPASTIKPILAAAFLSDPAVGARWLSREQAEMARPAALPSADSLRGELMRSASALSLIACSAPTRLCRLRAAVGHRGGSACLRLERPCTATRGLQARSAFGRGVLLLGADAIVPPSPEVPYGRLFTEPVGEGWGLHSAYAARRPSIRRSCANARWGRMAGRRARTIGENAAAASWSTSLPKVGDRVMHGRARSEARA